MIASRNYKQCIPGCGENEKIFADRCICKESAIESRAGKCVARLACPRIVLTLIPMTTDLYDESCADSPTCPNGYALDPDGKHCKESCASGKRAFDKVAGEYVCVDDCPEYAPVFDGD